MWCCTISATQSSRGLTVGSMTTESLRSPRPQRLAVSVWKLNNDLSKCSFTDVLTARLGRLSVARWMFKLFIRLVAALMSYSRILRYSARQLCTVRPEEQIPIMRNMQSGDSERHCSLFNPDEPR